MQPRYAPMLFLPSLSSDDFITVANVPQDEAVAFIEFFDKQVESKRKLGHNPSDNASGDLYEEYKGNLNLKALVEDESLGDLVETLSHSTIPKQRGRRAVFVDVENDVIAVGTTVVYNQNWAMRAVSDPTVMTTVLEAVEDASDALAIAVG